MKFLSYDDTDYVLQNKEVTQGLTPAGISWAFTTMHASNWHPLTWISHMIDWQIYGKYAGGHHITNVVLHTINAILVFLLLLYMTGFMWRSALVAALFALHPIHVESVAWVSERKDVLSTLFWAVHNHALCVVYKKNHQWQKWLLWHLPLQWDSWQSPCW